MGILRIFCALPMIAAAACSNYIVPTMDPAALSWYDVINSHVSAFVTTVLTCVAIPQKDIASAKAHHEARSLDHVHQFDH